MQIYKLLTVVIFGYPNSICGYPNSMFGYPNSIFGFLSSIFGYPVSYMIIPRGSAECSIICRGSG